MIALYIVLGLLVLIGILHLIAPKEMKMERSIVVSKSQQETYDMLRSLKQQDEWSVWAQKDPDMRKEFRGTDGEVGAVSFWSGNKDVGEGEQEIIALDGPSYIETELRFLKPFKSTSKGYFNIREVSDGSEVTWGFFSKNKFPFTIMMLFMNMDKTLGKDFETGLANLKAYME